MVRIVTAAAICVLNNGFAENQAMPPNRINL